MKKPRQIRQSTVAAEVPGFEAYLPRLVVVSLLLIFLAGCVVPPPTAVSVLDGKVQGTPSPVPAGILDGSVQSTTFEQVKEGIDNLYRAHPGVNSFVARGVAYTPATRDKVLKICHEGGLVSSEAEREAQQVLACAPLIYFFYRFGQEASVPESTDVARRLYWYAATSHPGESTKVLTELLRGWGLE